MNILVVLDDSSELDIDLPNVRKVSAKEYLLNQEFTDQEDIKVFNLCKSYRYQTRGYYVSLLAEARGHKPVPSIATIQDLKSPTMTKFASEDLEDLIQKQLEGIKSEKFKLSIYFGKNVAKRYDKLASSLFRLFHTPLIEVVFSYNSNGWSIQNISPMSVSEVPEEHKEFMIESAKEYLSKKRIFAPKEKSFRYSMAVLYDEESKEKPSNKGAIKKFIRAGNNLGIDIDLISKEDYSDIAEYDMLFIRETTDVNNHTFRFSRRAEAEGLEVIDDPNSILKCCNKVYLAELLKKNDVPAPKTMILQKQNMDIDKIIEELGFPVILKKPDSSFSLGVKKASNVNELKEILQDLFEKSELIIAQEFIKTEFDWRIGILDKKPLYACKYYMARSHWQIIKRSGGKENVGKDEAIPLELVPKNVLKMALKAANLIGDGLYGVDVKQVGEKVYVIEVNDNPNIDSGYEDKILGNSIYLNIMSSFVTRYETKRLKDLL